MNQCDFIVVGKLPAAEQPKDFTYALHAEGRKLRRAERSHARGPEDLNALFEGKQDFLVPHRQRLTEDPVDQSEHIRPIRPDRAHHIGLAGGR